MINTLLDSLQTFRYGSDIGRMDPTTKANWVAALRSSKYKQGFNALRVDDRLCCLGVYCEIAQMPKQARQEYDASGLIDGVKYFYGDKLQQSPVSIPNGYGIKLITNPNEWSAHREYFGYEDIFCVVSQEAGELQRWTLPMLNDSKAFNFDQIADIIDYFL